MWKWAYLEDVASRFEELDSVAVVGEGEDVVKFFLQPKSETLVVSFGPGEAAQGPRHEVFGEDPLQALLAFKQRLVLERFDVVYVAARGSFRETLRLLYALQGVAHDETLLIFTGCEEADHLRAWERCVERGLLEETRVIDAQWREGRFVFGRVFSKE